MGDSRKGCIKMKSKIALMIENKRLKDRVSELESQIANINEWNSEHLKTLHDELSVLLKELNSDKAKRIVADYSRTHVNRDNVH